MRKELEQIELIEKYLLNLLSKSEMKTIESRISGDKQFQKEVHSQLLLMEGIERVAIKREIESAKRHYYLVKKIKYLLLVMGAVLIAFAAHYYFTYQSNKEYDWVEQKNVPPNQLNLPISEDSIKVSTKTNETVLSDKSSMHESNAKQEIQFLDTLISAEVPRKKLQEFFINVNRDTSLTGTEGTIINIRANSFQTNQTTLKVVLKEYYKMSDIAFSPLSTLTVDGELLETGGMIYLNVIDNKDKRVALKAGSKVKIQFPYEQEKDGMGLYTGSQSTKNVVEWEKLESKQEVSKERPNNTITQDEPRREIMHIFSRKTPPPFLFEKWSAEEYFDRVFKFPEWTAKKRVSGSIEVSFLIDQSGMVYESRVIRGRKIQPELYDAILSVVNSFPRFEPQKTPGGKPVKYGFSIHLELESDGKRKYSDQEIRASLDSIKIIRSKESEMTLEEAEKHNRVKFEKQLLDAKGDTLTNRQKEALLTKSQHYVFETSELGWLNCDRSVNDEKRNKNFAINGIEGDANIKLIFHGVRVVMSAKRKEDKYVCPYVLMNENVTVFATKIIQGKPHYSLVDVPAGVSNTELKFTPLTLKSIEKIKQHINLIHS